MTSSRRIGGVAAIGALAAAIALVTGLPQAGADELSQLRANQELLQRRLDQLAQVGVAHPALPPGTPTIAGSFPRSFLIPGTNTSIAIGGYVKLDATYWFTGGVPNVNNGVLPPVIGKPVVAGASLDLHGKGLFAPPPFNPHSRTHVFNMSAAQSRLTIETRTPTAFGQAGTVIQGDFLGCTAGGPVCSSLNASTNAMPFRLRLAYGTLGGFMAGQNFVPVEDLAAEQEVLDFGGDAGVFSFTRAPQIRYTTPLPASWRLPMPLTVMVGAVKPSLSFFSPVGALQTDCIGTGFAGSSCPPTGLAVNPAKNTLPDGTFYIETQQPWGHARLSAAVTKLELQDGRFISKEYIGYGGAFTGNVHPNWFGWTRDNLTWIVYGGDGLGHYASVPTGTVPNASPNLVTNFGGAAVGGYGTCNANTPACLKIDSRANAARVIATTPTEWGGKVGYGHWWTPTLRSHAIFGIQHQDINGALLAAPSALTVNNYNKELVTAHFNLIWSPVPFIDTGFEYIWGHRLTLSNAKGDVSAVDFAFEVKF